MKSIIAPLFIFLGLVGIGLLFFLSQKANKGPRLKRLSWDEVTIGQIHQDRALVLSGIFKSIQILDGKGEQDTFQLADAYVSRKALLASLKRLQDLFADSSSQEGLLQSLRDEFIPYEIQDNSGDTGSMLVTGYFQPRLKASTNETGQFAYPVYGWPPDLIKVHLTRFDPALPAKTIWGRVVGRQLVPYYSRKDIEEKHPFPKGLALCWLSSPVDLLELQIQGSAIIDLDKGPTRFIHYAASNGLEYKSIGKILIKKGILQPGQLDWPSIRQWAQTHKKQFRELVYENPRYIFFQWEEKGPIGCYGKVLVPGTSVALDDTVFPPAMPALLVMKWPDIKKGPKWFRKAQGPLLVFHHDKGSAIKGPFRLDLYCGSGNEAGLLAGRLKNRARLLILLHRSVRLREQS